VYKEKAVENMLADKTVIDQLVKEYDVLRREPKFNFRSLQQLFIFGITATGALFSYAVTAHSAYVFLAGPIIVFACLSYRHTLLVSLVHIATYIRCHIEAQVPGLNWESFMFSQRNTPTSGWWLVRPKHHLGILPAFDALAIMCLTGAIAYSVQGSGILWLMLPACVLLTLPLVWVNVLCYKATDYTTFEKCARMFRISKASSDGSTQPNASPTVAGRVLRARLPPAAELFVRFQKYE
jgi:hypothetical protein